MGELKILAQQGGLISRQQAMHTGLSTSTIHRRLTGGQWRPVYPGVYRHVAAAVSDQLMLDAARLWLGPKAVVSGSWAAWWHDLREEPSGPVSVTMPRTATAHQHQHIQVRRRNLFGTDVVSVRGVLVTSRALTALENVAIGGQDCFDRALQRHIAIPELSDAMDRLTNATGAPAARAALRDARGGTVSPPERTLAAALREAGLTEVTAGVRVRAGGRWCWLDFAVVAVRLAIEVDGISAHSDPTAFKKDRKRQNALIRAGWTVLRYTPWEIRNELPEVIAEIRGVLQDLVGNVPLGGPFPTESGGRLRLGR